MESGLSLSAPPPISALLDHSAIALFLDFDGTLVDIAPSPDAIAPISGLSQKLSSLAHRLDGRCAIVSGRAIADIERHIGLLDLPMAGSHGSDIRGPDGAAIGKGASTLPPEIEAELRAFAAHASVDYEHKPHGGALHYRQNPSAGDAVLNFATELAGKHGWAVQSGKCVVEIVARDANKGAAVHQIMQIEPFKGARAFFLGDDLTDEAGFAACEAHGGTGILVGNRPDTRARYRLPDVQSVHQWLEF
ncbi:trehalose 6-phosphate phosphatase [Erythrobacter sp. Dej080120_24]|nr:trehalose 6-phosphate phosphatase [Erythrobacter sp. Dej080120_24]